MIKGDGLSLSIAAALIVPTSPSMLTLPRIALSFTIKEDKAQSSDPMML